MQSHLTILAPLCPRTHYLLALIVEKSIPKIDESYNYGHNEESANSNKKLFKLDIHWNVFESDSEISARCNDIEEKMKNNSCNDNKIGLRLSRTWMPSWQYP